MSAEFMDAPEVGKLWPKTVQEGGGFCAGVERSVNEYRAFVATHPTGSVYSVGEPAHNPHVNNEFKDQGVVFVNTIDEVPAGMNVLFGPHGNTVEDAQKAEALGGDWVETECPLVTKPKKEIAKNTELRYQTIYYGQILKDGKHHPETRSAMSAGRVLLVTSLEEALSDELYDQINDPDKVAFASQTTHNADEATEIEKTLRETLFPNLKSPVKQDICYATRNRQLAAKNVAAPITVIVGDLETSSNTRSLAKVAEERGSRVIVVNDASELIPEDFYGANAVAVIGSASAPRKQIGEVIGFFVERGSTHEMLQVEDESRIHFAPPRVHSAKPPEVIWTS